MKNHFRMSRVTPKMPILFPERKFFEIFHNLATISQLCLYSYITDETIRLYLLPQLQKTSLF